jgi:hypothetical protein
MALQKGLIEPENGTDDRVAAIGAKNYQLVILVDYEEERGFSEARR